MMVFVYKLVVPTELLQSRRMDVVAWWIWNCEGGVCCEWGTGDGFLLGERGKSGKIIVSDL